jgi:hypothetical protein
LKLYGTHQLLVYADDVNIMGGSLHTIRKNTKALVADSKETGLEVNSDRTVHMVVYGDQNEGRSHNIKIDNSSFERMEQFKYLETTLMHQNSIQKQIKNILTSGNACHHSVQNFLSSSLLSKNVNIKIHRNIILPVVLYGCETCSLTLKEEGRLRVFENRVLRRIFGPKRNELTGEWRRLYNEELNDLNSSTDIILLIKSRIIWWTGHVAHMR